MDNFQIIVGGAAGEGSKKAGQILARLFNSRGFRVFVHEDYHSLIRGGHNFSQITVNRDRQQNAISEKIDFLLALNEETITKHQHKLKDGGILIYDSDSIEAELPEDNGFEVLKVPAANIIEEAEASNLMKNTALIAALAKSVGMDWEKTKQVLSRLLTKETDKNLQVAEIAFSQTEQLKELAAEAGEPLPVLTGNSAIAVGAIRAGLENYIAYPMTPATGVLTYLVNVPGVKTAQPENEISVINMAIGSAFAGRRTMIGSSGGGFALMSESISLLAQSETPMQIVLSQRMGPATGVPTYVGQCDLDFALNVGHGDMQRLVTAPGDGDEAYYLSGWGLNMAWKYQLPVILMTDKELSENTYVLTREQEIYKEEPNEAENTADYLRYDGEDISPLQYPGGQAVVKATGYEHTPGGISEEEPEGIVAMQNKRLRKYDKLKEELEQLETVKSYGQGKVAVIFWGSVKGAILEAAQDLPIKLVQPLVLQPFPENQMKAALEGAEKVVCVELNSTGQLARVLRGHGIEVNDKILKYDARPFTIEGLREQLQALVN